MPDRARTCCPPWAFRAQTSPKAEGPLRRGAGEAIAALAARCTNAVSDHVSTDGRKSALLSPADKALGGGVVVSVSARAGSRHGRSPSLQTGPSAHLVGPSPPAGEDVP